MEEDGSFGLIPCQKRGVVKEGIERFNIAMYDSMGMEK
jgi:hypothetical protein